MNCPKCGAKTWVDETRPIHALIERTRVCESCRERFKTIEYIPPEPNTKTLRPTS